MSHGEERPGEADQGFEDPTQSMELAWQGQRGDAQAVNDLFARYIPRMRRVLNIKIGRWQRSSVDPEDVLQETLIVATRRLPELEVRSHSSILQWLSKIADFEIKNRVEYLKAEKRDPARERRIRSDEDSMDTSDLGVLVPFAGPSPSQFVERSEFERCIDACVETLDPPDYREVILMRDYYDADWEAIRVAMERPTLKAAQDLYARARERLKERLAKYQA